MCFGCLPLTLGSQLLFDLVIKLSPVSRRPRESVSGCSAMPSSAGPGSPAAALVEALENSGRLIDKHLLDDRCFPDLSELLSVPFHSEFCPDGASDKYRKARVYISGTNKSVVVS